MKVSKLMFFVFFIFTFQTFSQVYSDKIVGKKNEEIIDSLKIEKYPYALPIWGEKVAQKGYKLPYSAGVSVNYFWQESEIVINDLEVGFNNGPKYNLDEIVRFDKSTVEAGALTIRPDIWLLPFLNIYGIFGKANTGTKINAGIYVPDADNNWSQIVSFGTKASFEATTFGLGMTPTIGIGGGWFALDMNMAWTDISSLDKPAFSYVFGPRLGKTFKLRNPERNITGWVGGFRVHISGDTNGNLPLSDLFDLSTAQEKVDSGFEKIAENQTKVDNWWEGLTPAEQKKPGNVAKHNTANRALESAGNILASLDGALSTAESSSIQYSLQKRPKDMWNFIVGSQFQYNKHLMFRAECGFLGSRTQVLGSLQYRFGL
ncbi:hypothetical protein [Flavobacterium fluviatile]|uniref:hypothetical protein n=1 Tax=Flavobacterium fluviatile TaxID=1862387 RepID=UPI0013D7A749|nr:hypothetical protein [Flavobacterium fluviatile]